MITKAEVEVVMFAFHAKFEQFQAVTDRKLAQSHHTLVHTIIEQVNQHMYGTRDQLYQQLSDRLMAKDSDLPEDHSPNCNFTMTHDRRTQNSGSDSRPPQVPDRYQASRIDCPVRWF
jgi:hypothetical protein